MFLGENKVLLIEDNPDHAELITELLEVEGNKEVILIKDGKEAIDYFQKAYPPEACQTSPPNRKAIRTDIDGDEIEPQIDLVILDLNLPKVHGMDVLKFLKQNSRYRSIPVVILSTSTDDKTINEAYKNGANGYITKPVSYDGFVEKIKILNNYFNEYDKLNNAGINPKPLML
ncbi:MAG: response regulator [Candidatus Scalindua sediminis]